MIGGRTITKRSKWTLLDVSRNERTTRKRMPDSDVESSANKQRDSRDPKTSTSWRCGGGQIEECRRENQRRERGSIIQVTATLKGKQGNTQEKVVGMDQARNNRLSASLENKREGEERLLAQPGFSHICLFSLSWLSWSVVDIPDALPGYLSFMQDDRLRFIISLSTY